MQILASSTFKFQTEFLKCWFKISVVGEKEKTNSNVNVRTRDNKVHGEKSIDYVIEKFQQLASQRIINSEDFGWDAVEN